MNKEKSIKINNKAFTLTELLAVVIILGVLLLFAVPMISGYIENSKKNTYISSVKSIVNAVATSVNALKLPFNLEENEGIIVPFSEVNLEKTSAKTKSPYGKYISKNSFVLVIYDGKNYKYYVSAIDDKDYAIPLVNEKSLSTKSITNNKDEYKNNIISYEDVIKSGNSESVFDTDAITFTYLKHKGKYVKIKIGYTPYNAGDIVKLKDGSLWYVINKSPVGDETINLVSYYNMDTKVSNYGKQNSSNPTIQFHPTQQNPALYNSDASIYNVAENIVSSTNIRLVQNKINMTGANVSMPSVTDFGCSITDASCNVSCFSGKTGVKTFWTTDTKGEWVFTIGTSMGRANTESTGIGIKVVIKNLLKSNIDKEATSNKDFGIGDNNSGSGNNDSNVEAILKEQILKDNIAKADTSIDFSKVNSDTNGEGLYYTYTNTEDNKTTYYFRGDVTNNYVNFAGHKWRIIRINEDGSIRMIKTSSIGNSYYNKGVSGNSSVGYMYGKENGTYYNDVHANVNDSVVKGVIDKWYESNLKTNYASYLADAGFCNDRSVTSWNNNNAISSTQYYNAGYRLRSSRPQFACPQDNDLFTTSSSSKGNKALKYPIGLITADEVIYAGNVFETYTSYNSFATGNNTYYLFHALSSSTWTMTPTTYWISTSGIAYITPGYFTDYYGDSTQRGVYPVINLKSTVKITKGNGTSSNPYVIKTN